MEAVEKIFKEPVQMLIKQDVTSNIMGMDITLKTANLGETIEALGGDDFPKKIQQKYKDAGKPLCNARTHREVLLPCDSATAGYFITKMEWVRLQFSGYCGLMTFFGG
jgi:hypothetical protein